MTPPPGATPPAWLSESARAMWDDLAPVLERNGLLTEVDSLSLAALCITAAQIRKLEEMGAPVDARLLAELRQHEVLFGIAPAARGKVKANKPKPESKLDKFTARGRR